MGIALLPPPLLIHGSSLSFPRGVYAAGKGREGMEVGGEEAPSLFLFLSLPPFLFLPLLLLLPSPLLLRPTVQCVLSRTKGGVRLLLRLPSSAPDASSTPSSLPCTNAWHRIHQTGDTFVKIQTLLRSFPISFVKGIFAGIFVTSFCRIPPTVGWMVVSAPKK